MRASILSGVPWFKVRMKNSYYAFRHGQSRANVEGIIVSDPAVGTVDYGLTEEGRQQVRASVAAAGLGAEAQIYASDFLRARETAELIQTLIGAEPITFDTRLRERFFGDWEGKSHVNYSKTWHKDAFEPDREYAGAERAIEVRARMWAVIESLEARHAGETIVLVSHGDPLMLLETAFAELEAGAHRSLPYISTGGCRRLV